MKRKKICKYLCLLIILVCSVLFTTSLTAVAVQPDGSMEVIAHIETAPAETTPPVTDAGGSSGGQEKGDISTGEVLPLCAVASLLMLEISVLVIYICNKKDKSCSK